MRRRPPMSTLFPYTTLCRSGSSVSPLCRSLLQLQELPPLRPCLRHRSGDLRGDECEGDTERSLPPAACPPWSHSKDRKSTRLNSSHANISYAVFCLKKTQTPAHPARLPQYDSNPAADGLPLAGAHVLLRPLLLAC